jgi:guanidinopropionase
MIKTIANYPELADPQLRPHYTGIPTFFRLHFTETLSNIDIGIVGVPFDSGVTKRTGARRPSTSAGWPR